MLRRFWRDERGNYAMLAGICMVPLLGGLALAVDYTEMTRQRQAVQNALDAAGVATAKQIVSGAADDAVKAYGKNFFDANLGAIDPAAATLSIVLPDNNSGGGTLKMSARLKYKPYFLNGFDTLMRRSATQLEFSAATEIRLKNTVEVALVLDNSGSMAYLGTNSTKQRMQLLKDAAKQLVTTMAGQAKFLKQMSDPIQFALVPFAASVNVGADNRHAAWMDTTGISPIHHENLDWSTFNQTRKYTEAVNGAVYARGTDWGALKDTALTRFTLFDSMLRVTGTSGGRSIYGAATSWSGCVEARPYPMNINDTTPTVGNPASLFVPMFAPDENDPIYYNRRWYPAVNNWWTDATADDYQSLDQSKYKARQKDARKYFTAALLGTGFMGSDAGPNYSCSTMPIMPLTDVSTDAGAKLITDAIDDMVPDGATNVPEGMAWGWRTLSSAAPFTKGRAETEKGNDKVLIVLTDGANTYYTPEYFGRYDAAGNQSSYSSYGYAGTPYAGGDTRLFRDPGVSNKSDYSESNYTKALNANFSSLCANSAFIRNKKDSSGKTTREGQITVITIALDLDTKDTTENGQIEALKACASPSRVNPDKLLFFNATGATLDVVFKEIANELSNLRIVG